MDRADRSRTARPRTARHGRLGRLDAAPRDRVVFEGGPLGKTRRVSPAGLEDVTNELAGLVVVRAESHEAAARMFEAHPHFTLFPGEAIEVMPILPVPSR